MLVQLLPEGTAEKHMGCLLTLESIPLLCMHFTDHSDTECVHNRIMDCYTEHMAGFKRVLRLNAHQDAHCSQSSSAFVTIP